MQYQHLVGYVLIAVAIVIAGSMNRYSVGGASGSTWRVDGWTGEVRICRDYGSTNESLCENPAQYRDSNTRAAN